uniref:Uncharacterized protein n=1 Tax=Colletotrichum fructicola (strain Nara gc5) TaxID=1213859 RepID=L2G730_COLFN
MLASLLLARTLLAFASACLRLPFGVAIVAVAAAATAITSGQSAQLASRILTEEYSRNRDIHGREPGTSKKLDRVTVDPRLPASAGTSRPLQTLHLLLQRVPITNQTSTNKSKMPRNNNLDSRYLGVPTTGKSASVARPFARATRSPATKPQGT